MESSVASSAADWELARSLAKLGGDDGKELLGGAQTLRFASPLLSDDVRLVELPKELVEEVEAGRHLVLKGQPDEGPVLCTRDKTYVVKEAETSNALLLVPSLRLHRAAEGEEENEAPPHSVAQVPALKHTYLELKRVPRLDTGRLKELVRSAPFAFPGEEAPSEPLLTTDYLLDRVQTSHDELVGALSALPVVWVCGGWRWAEAETLHNAVEELLNGVDAGKLLLHAVDETVAGELMGKPPSELVRKVLSLHGTSKGDGVWALEPRLVARRMGEGILRLGKALRYDDFLQMWRSVLPVGCEPEVGWLRGLALEEGEGHSRALRYLPVDDLPQEPQSRLDVLFRARQRWPEEELRAYLEDIAPSSKEVGVLLTKYCRSTMVKAVRMLNSKESAYAKH